MAILSFIVAILATYRMAHLLPDDDGPFYVFKRIRSGIYSKVIAENDEWGFWAMINDGINCAYCCGLYAAIIAGALVTWNNFYGNLFLLIMAIAGGQSVLQAVTKE